MMLSPEEREKIRREIEAKLKSVKKNMESLRAQSKPVSPDNAIGRITRMDAIQQRSMAEAALRKAEEEQIKLKEALDKIDGPDFGVCIRCRRAIPIGRIMIMPEARTCVHCAGKLF